MVEAAFAQATRERPCGLFIPALFPGVSQRGNHGASLRPSDERQLWLGEVLPESAKQQQVGQAQAWWLEPDPSDADPWREPRERDRAWLSAGLKRLYGLFPEPYDALRGAILRSVHAWEARAENLLRRDSRRPSTADAMYRKLYGIGPYGARTEPIGTAWLRAVKLTSMYYVAWRLSGVPHECAWERTRARLDQPTGGEGCWWDNLIRDAANTTAGPSALRTRRQQLRPEQPLWAVVEQWTVRPDFPWAPIRDALPNAERRRFVRVVIASLLLLLSRARRAGTKPPYDAFYGVDDAAHFGQKDFQPAYLYRWACLVGEAREGDDGHEDLTDLYVMAGDIHRWGTDIVATRGLPAAGDGPVAAARPAWEGDPFADHLRANVQPFLRALARALLAHLDLVDSRRPW